jgi:hypothetical protein
MKKLFVFCLTVIILLLLTTCAPGPNQLTQTENEEGKVAGFWMGLWHGLIAPITFIVSLFTKNVNVYEVHNNGGCYNFGFILGLMIIFGGSSGGAGRVYKRKKDK